MLNIVSEVGKGLLNSQKQQILATESDPHNYRHLQSQLPKCQNPPEINSWLRPWIQDLKEGIREAIKDIGHRLCDLVMENFIKRIWSCKRGRGGHLPDVIFHY